MDRGKGEGDVTIPETIDVLALVLDLNTNGWRDYKIEIACILPKGYLSQVKSGRIQNPRYEIAARIFNFHQRAVLNNPDLLAPQQA